MEHHPVVYEPCERDQCTREYLMTYTLLRHAIMRVDPQAIQSFERDLSERYRATFAVSRDVSAQVETHQATVRAS